MFPFISMISDVFIVNFEQIWHLFSNVSMVDFGQVNIWGASDFHCEEVLPKTGVTYGNLTLSN